MKTVQQQIANDIGTARQNSESARSHFAAAREATARSRIANLGYEPLRELERTIEENREVARKSNSVVARMRKLMSATGKAGVSGEQAEVDMVLAAANELGLATIDAAKSKTKAELEKSLRDVAKDLNELISYVAGGLK